MRRLRPSVNQLIRQAYLLGRQVSDAQTRAQGITISQYGILRRLADAPGSSGADLARGMFMTPQAIQELLGSMEAAGLVERVTDENHSRIRRSRLTTEGHEALDRVNPAVRSVEATLLKPFTTEERRQLRDLLERYVTAGQQQSWPVTPISRKR